MYGLNKKLQKIKTYPNLKEATILVGSGITYQVKNNRLKAKENIGLGIEKIKKILVSDSSVDRENIINYVSNFEEY